MGHFTMATVGTLYTYPHNFRAYKALIAAQYSGSKINVASDFVFGETNKSEQFLKKFPLGKVPAFETPAGEVIAESNAIAYYVANQQLRGDSDVDKAQVLQWMNLPTVKCYRCRAQLSSPFWESSSTTRRLSSPNQRTPLTLFPKGLLILMISNDSTPTMRNRHPFPISGKSSTRRITQSGMVNTNTMKS